MDLQLLSRYETARVPRYTSYPTAPHFSPAIDGAVYADWLRAVPRDEPLSLYLHVPYCARLCWYCGCSTSISQDPGRIGAYVELLRSEIELVGRHVGPGLEVSHLHWGGGTPSAIGAQGFTAVMADLARLFAWTRDAEIAIELDPRVADDAMIEAAARAGINRASLGIQSFDPKVQEAINRVQGFEVSRDCVVRLRAAGIERINADILYGLPFQTEANSRETIERLMELRPDRVSVFGYAHLPRMLKHQRMIADAALPGTIERARQYAVIGKALEDEGYVAIGLDHFARPDDPMARAVRDKALRRNFQGYTTDRSRTLIGLGASAISSLGQGYAQNDADLRAYRRAIRLGRFATARGIALQTDDVIRRRIIEAIMCDGRVDLAQIAHEFGVPIERCAPDEARLDGLVRDGIAGRRGSEVWVSPECRGLMRLVAAAFDRYLDPSHRRHAVAV